MASICNNVVSISHICLILIANTIDIVVLLIYKAPSGMLPPPMMCHYLEVPDCLLRDYVIGVIFHFAPIMT